MKAEDERIGARSVRSTDVQEIPSANLYPNWSASMQGYYGSGASIPPYFTSSAASLVSHPFLWPSQHPMVSPYGAPLPHPSIYPLGSLYAPGIPSISMTQHTASANTATEGKAYDSRDPIPISVSQKNKDPGNAVVKGENPEESEKVAPLSEHDGASQSDGGAFPSSSETSDDNASQEASSATKKRDFNQLRDCGMTPLNLERSNALGTPREMASAAMDPREIKREKRKQSNRESARRSRLRKMAECEELQVRVDLLNTETQVLREELQRLAEECEKVTSENNTIMEELTHLGGYNATSNITFGDHAAAVCSVKDKDSGHWRCA